MTTTTPPIADPRAWALAWLQLLDPNGEYTDRQSADNGRQPCTLSEAIRSAAALVDDDLPPAAREAFYRLSLWAAEVGQ